MFTERQIDATVDIIRQMLTGGENVSWLAKRVIDDNGGLELCRVRWRELSANDLHEIRIAAERSAEQSLAKCNRKL